METWRHEDIEMETWNMETCQNEIWEHGDNKACRHADIKQKRKPRRFPFCSSYKRTFFVSPSVDGGTNRIYSFANGQNGLNRHVHLC
jgi:hypothetical protein